MLTDLQKLFGCQAMLEEDKQFDCFSPSEKSQMKIRVAETERYSARLNLVFRSNVLLRRRSFETFWIDKMTALNCFCLFPLLM